MKQSKNINYKRKIIKRLDLIKQKQQIYDSLLQVGKNGIQAQFAVGSFMPE